MPENAMSSRNEAVTSGLKPMQTTSIIASFPHCHFHRGDESDPVPQNPQRTHALGHAAGSYAAGRSQAGWPDPHFDRKSLQCEPATNWNATPIVAK